MNIAMLREKLHQYIDTAEEGYLASLYQIAMSSVDPPGNRSKPVLTPEQVKLVNEERSKISSDPDHFTDWEEARKKLQLKK